MLQVVDVKEDHFDADQTRQRNDHGGWSDSGRPRAPPHDFTSRPCRKHYSFSQSQGGYFLITLLHSQDKCLFKYVIFYLGGYNKPTWNKPSSLGKCFVRARCRKPVTFLCRASFCLSCVFPFCFSTTPLLENRTTPSSTLVEVCFTRYAKWLLILIFKILVFVLKYL